MNRLLLIRNSVRQKDAFSGVVTVLGVLSVETVYLVFDVILGVNFFKRGTFYQMLKQAGEENKTNSQTANVLGTLLYALIILLFLPVMKAIAIKIFGD